MLTDDPTSSLTTTTNQKIIPNENLCCPNGYYMGPSGDCKIVIDNPSFGITSTNNSFYDPKMILIACFRLLNIDT